jgi:hypothetical protein
MKETLARLYVGLRNAVMNVVLPTYFPYFEK